MYYRTQMRRNSTRAVFTVHSFRKWQTNISKGQQGGTTFNKEPCVSAITATLYSTQGQTLRQF